ncbi:protein phosphatase regulator [Marasmius crinis-equi]|uniref:Protein phosphatase regulator n=1 Tax=Marasmius crinis-equi TaxID=585013 RepID=A0ABR3FLE4_9AGAR
MAHYLPVLMHSVTANLVPDDSSLETQARGQVDYLSHDWREEDVWRSWRNMTRQKNEIANGMRLENASWRTWWKQRNKLKTINPETLNWLKDSDVTWLYGPLHTAVEWTPPPRPTRDETKPKVASAQDRLDLQMPKHKSILKYRTISELLTSDLPHSPLLSPHESDGEAEGLLLCITCGGLRPPSYKVIVSRFLLISNNIIDETIANSPPRIEPPGAAGASSTTDSNTVANTRQQTTPTRISSSTNLTNYFTSHQSSQQAHASSSSNSNSASASPRGTSSELSNPPAKKKHITFNTFVEQCIAIDKPKTPGQSAGKGTSDDIIDQDAELADDDGYDEDVEGGDDFDADWGLNECAITDSDSDFEEEIFIQDDDDDEEEEVPVPEPNLGDDGVIEMRTSRQTKKDLKRTLRSKSKASTSSSSSADSYASSSASSTKKRRSSVSTLPRRRRSGTGAENLLRSNSNSTARPSFSHSRSKGSSSGSDHHTPQMVTIAPIAPTMLKTGGSNFAHPAHSPAWDGFGVHPEQSTGLSDWLDGFGDEALSDDGGFGGVMGRYNGYNSWRSSESDQESLGTPVELVYMPPPSGRYGSSYGGKSSSSGRNGGNGVNSSVNGEDAEVEQMEEAGEARRLGRNDEGEEGQVQLKRTHSGTQLHAVAEDHSSQEQTQPPEEREKKSKRKPTSGLGPSGASGSSVPIVVRTPPVVERPGRGSEDEDEEDAYDYFGGPDLGGDYATRRHTSRRNVRAPEVGGSSPSSSPNDERQSRSRSRSKSRTPSPHALGIAVPGHHSSSPTHSELLSPPLRGRGTTSGDSSSRGRSSARTSSSSLSDRERPRSRSNHSSPIGSLSPDGSGIGLNYGVYATGRIGDRDRDRERDRDRPARSGGRGRERTERKLSHSLSPDFGGVTSSPTPSLPSTPSREFPPSSPSIQSTSDLSEGTSSVSSSQTIVPSSSTAPTSPCLDGGSSPSVPTNTPVISMSGAAHAIAQMDHQSPSEESKSLPIKGRMRSPPIDITQPHMSSPKTSYSVDPSLAESNDVPRDALTHAPGIRKSSLRDEDVGTLKQPGSPGSEDPSIVGKAAGIMSSARAYFGLWSNGEREKSES